jgi:hypothetical protein
LFIIFLTCDVLRRKSSTQPGTFVQLKYLTMWANPE